MTRCSYIPDAGLSVIALAKERGGTTEGDIAALVDRFGCRSEATHVVAVGDADEPDELRDACRDHVGHLLGDDASWVHPIERSEVTISIVNTPIGIARAGFGPPMVLAPHPTATPVVDLGDNPTREQIEALMPPRSDAEYRKVLGMLGLAEPQIEVAVAARHRSSAFTPMPLPDTSTVGVARSCACGAELLYSARQRSDGLCGPCHRKATWTQTNADALRARYGARHVDLIAKHAHLPWGEARAAIEAEARGAAPVVTDERDVVAPAVGPDGEVPYTRIAQARLRISDPLASITLTADGWSLTLHPSQSVAMEGDDLRIVAPLPRDARNPIVFLRDQRALVMVSGHPGRYAIAMLSFNADAASPDPTLTLVLRRIQFVRDRLPPTAS